MGRFKKLQHFIPFNLDEAADEYAPDFSNSIASKAAVDAIRDAFKAGAQWQKQQNALETKDVNLEKELKTLDNTLFDLDGVAIAGTTCYLTVEDVKDIAKRFYELGLTHKGE